VISSDNGAMLTARRLLTPAVVDRLVNECIGAVPVIGIVGRCPTGKTQAAVAWVAGRALHFAGIEQDVRPGHYPSFALDGIDIVVVDEPALNAAFVRALTARTAPDAGTAAHRLVVLLLPDLEAASLFGFRPGQFRPYTIAGQPIDPR